MRDIVEHMSHFLIIILVIGLFLVASNVIYDAAKKIDTDKESAYLTCVDKEINTISTGKTFIKNHYVIFFVEGRAYNILVSSGEYSDIEIDSEVLCTLYVSKKTGDIKDISIGKD